MRRKYSKILVLGYFGYRTNQLDGQTVKTRNILELLKKKYPNNHTVKYFDTEELHYNVFSLFTMLWFVCRSCTVIYLPAHNNLARFASPLLFLSKLFGFQIVYVVVGGWLAKFLQDHPNVRKSIAQYVGILTETIIVKEQLEKLFDFKNVKVFPNFRLEVPSAHSTTPTKHSEFRIVFMARIHRMKGLDWMDVLASHIEGKYEKGAVAIDFFGPLNSEDESSFYEILSRNKDTMSYHGTLEPSDIVQTLSRYDVLILPTHYFTEGFPGSVLDAYRSGIPVVVTDWLHAKQFVKNGETGFIVPFESGEKDLCDRVDYLIQNPEELKRLKQQALEQSLLYSPDAAWQILELYLND